MAEEKTLEYMGKTLLRNGNTVFYGDRNTGIWLQITILETVKVSELDLATKVLLQIVDHNKGKATILKQAEKKSFYDAFELGYIWLERAEKGSL